MPVMVQVGGGTGQGGGVGGGGEVESVEEEW